MEKLGDIVKKRLHQHRLGESSQASSVLFDAQKWLAGHFEKDPRAVRPIKLQNAVLWLSVAHAGWAQEAHSVSRNLLSSLQSRYGATRVRKILIKSI